MAFNIKTYHKNLDQIMEIRGCTRAEAKVIYRERGWQEKQKAPAKPKKESKPKKEPPPEVFQMGPEQVVEHAHSKQGELGVRISELEVRLQELKEEQGMWESIARVLDEDNPAAVSNRVLQA